MNILFLSRWLPAPANNGSKLRILGLIRGLAQQHSITLLCFAEPAEMKLDVSELRSICSAVHLVPWKEFNSQSWRARVGLLSLIPRSLIDTHSDNMDGAIRRLLAQQKYDLVIASQLSMASYYPSFGDVPAIFEELELGLYHSKPMLVDGFMRRLRLKLTWFKLRNYVRRLCGSFRFVTVASEQEWQMFVDNFPGCKGKTVIIPNSLHIADYQPIQIEQIPNQLVYPGSLRFYPNFEAMQWFVEAVFPRIVKQVPGAQLLITGDPADTVLPKSHNIILTGYVNDIKSIVNSSAVCLAPLLSGGGTRLKILESMALGTPVVATSKGAEGLGAVSGQHLLVADTPDEFANQVVKLLQDPILHNQLSTNGRQFVAGNYSWDIVLPRFLDIVERAAS